MSDVLHECLWRPVRCTHSKERDVGTIKCRCPQGARFGEVRKRGVTENLLPGECVWGTSTAVTGRTCLLHKCGQNWRGGRQQEGGGRGRGLPSLPCCPSSPFLSCLPLAVESGGYEDTSCLHIWTHP